MSRVVDGYIDEEAKEVAEVFEEGVISESEGYIVPYLLVEGAGTNIALQREEERRVGGEGGDSPRRLGGGGPG